MIPETMTGREVFELATTLLNDFLVYKHGYRFQEFLKPNGEIERWWTGNDEEIIIKYKQTL